MNKAWLKYNAWFAKLKEREQQIIAVAVLVGIVFMGYTYAIEPSLIKASVTSKAAQEARATLSGIDQQSAILKGVNRDPDAPLRAQLDEVKAKLGGQNERFQAVEKSLVMPSQMPGLLENLLAKSRSTQLLSLKTMPPTPLIERKAAADAKPAVTGGTPVGAPNLFKHGFEIKVGGNYADLMAYITELENSPQRLIWGSMKLETAEYPRSTLTLVVYTLSLDKQWLTL